MIFKEITGIDECKALWDKFSPKSSVWDIWGIAYSFHKGYNADPFFILGEEGGKEMGILHLQHEENDGEKWTDFFGGDYLERRTFYIRDKALINSFLEKSPKDISLTFIGPGEKEFVNGIKECDIAYSLNLEHYGYDLDRYFSGFNKKHRKNLRYDLRSLEKQGYKVVLNDKGHLSRLAELNMIRFGEESNFNDPRFYESFKLLLDAAEKLGILHLLSIKINNKVEASQVALFYNGVYTVLTGGSNPEIVNLGKLLIVEHIRNAISLRSGVVDFMTYESGWKKLWNLDETMLYKYEK